MLILLADTYFCDRAFWESSKAKAFINLNFTKGRGAGVQKFKGIAIYQAPNKVMLHIKHIEILYLSS